MNTTPNKRKKVLLMVTKSNAGGAQKYVFDLARSLPHDTFEVVVAAGGNGSLIQQCASLGIRTISIPFLERDISLFKEIKAFFSIITLLRKEQPDVVHLNSPKMGGLGGLAARITGIKKIIYTSHGWTFNEDRPWWQKILIKVFSWIIVSLSTATITISKTESKQVSHWPFIQKKLVSIPLGIEPPHFLLREAARKALFTLAGTNDQGQQLIFSIGELTTNKGYSYALEALRQYSKDYVYLIAGTGELENQLKNNVTSSPHLDSRVHFLGYVSQAAQYMEGADLLLLPSIKEGVPYVLLEAAYADIPVIATHVGGISEIVSQATITNLVPPHSSAALLNALEDQRVVDCTQYTLEKMVTNTLEHYL
ncbi:MAG: hypothetical protein RLY57_115 [Candidatus Parcubacteria bacterium]|jgi:glycosyltransferase involved in cell wall biosynthesis